MLDELDNARSSIALALTREPACASPPELSPLTDPTGSRDFSEGYRWTKQALERVDCAADPATEASLWHSLSALTSGNQCVTAANEAITRLQRLGDSEGLAGAYLRLSVGYRQLARFEEAAAACDRALAFFGQASRTRSIVYASALGWRASALIVLGRHAEAREGFAAGIALVEALGDFERAAVERLNLEELEFAAGRVASALSIIETSLAVLRGRQAAAESTALMNAAAYRIVLGELSSAYEAAADALRLTRRLGSPQLRTFPI